MSSVAARCLPQMHGRRSAAEHAPQSPASRHCGTSSLMPLMLMTQRDAQRMQAHAHTRYIAIPSLLMLLHHGAPLQSLRLAAKHASSKRVGQSRGSDSTLQGSLCEAFCPRTGPEEPALVQLSLQLSSQGILVCQIPCSAPAVVLSLSLGTSPAARGRYAGVHLLLQHGC